LVRYEDYPATTEQEPQRKTLEDRRMRSEAVHIDNPNVVGQLEKLSAKELDDLPFGVIRIDSAGLVLFYSQTEARFSGYGQIPMGLNLFELSSCLSSDDLGGA